MKEKKGEKLSMTVTNNWQFGVETWSQKSDAL